MRNKGGQEGRNLGLVSDCGDRVCLLVCRCFFIQSIFVSLYCKAKRKTSVRTIDKTEIKFNIIFFSYRNMEWDGYDERDGDREEDTEGEEDGDDVDVDGDGEGDGGTRR
jgi:hypothetical protein